MPRAKMKSPPASGVAPFVLLGYLKVMLPGALNARRPPTDTVLVCPWRNLREGLEVIHACCA